jgi:hypothetical protein
MEVCEKVQICKFGFTHVCDSIDAKEVRILQEDIESFHEVESWVLSLYVSSQPFFQFVMCL